MDKEIEINYILSILRIKRKRFYKLLNRYKRETSNYRINPKIKTSIIQELIISRIRLHKFTKCKTETKEENLIL